MQQHVYRRTKLLGVLISLRRETYMGEEGELVTLVWLHYNSLDRMIWSEQVSVFRTKLRHLSQALLREDPQINGEATMVWLPLQTRPRSR